MRSSRIYPSVLDRIIDIQRALESSLNFLKLERHRKLSLGSVLRLFSWRKASCNKLLKVTVYLGDIVPVKAGKTETMASIGFL